jgi:ADP-heptose:LPS heptosyltransferase
MKKIALIQLNRLGDIVQTLTALEGLMDNNEYELTLITRASFGQPLEKIISQYVHKHIMLDIRDIFADSKLENATHKLSQTLSALNSQNFDLSINLTFDKTSSYLNTLINSRFKLGLQRNRLNELVINDSWSQYVYSNIMASTYSTYNLVDIFKNIIGNKANIDSTPKELTNNIVIHPFASMKKKQWQISKWVEVIYSLLKSNPSSKIHLVGGSPDLESAKLITSSPILKQFSERLIIQAGQLNVTEVDELLYNARLFVGNDSMVSHLAGRNNTPSLILSLGPVRPIETTPYSDNVINVSPNIGCFPCTVEEKCDLLPCHNKINHQLVSTLANEIYKNKSTVDINVERVIPDLHLMGVNVFKNEFNSDGLSLKSLISRKDDYKFVLQNLYRGIWSFYFKGDDSNLNTPSISEETAGFIGNFMDGLNNLFEIYNFAVKYTNRICVEAESQEPNLQTINESVTRLREIDSLLQATKRTFPEVSPLADFFYVAKSNVAGENIQEVSKNSQVLYYEAANLTAALFDLCNQIVTPFIKDQTKDEQHAKDA